MQTEDMKWIRKIQKRNDRESADRLIRKYYKEIYSFQYSHCRNKTDALDLSQETFISVLRSINTYNPALSSFRTWLYHIAFRKYIDHTRLNTYVSLPEDVSSDFTDPSDLEKIIHDRILLEKIEETIKTMEPLLQEIWYLHLYEEFSFSEIAQAVHLPESNVKAKYYRLLKYIRRTYEQEYKD